MRVRDGNPFAVDRPGAWLVYDFVADRRASAADPVAAANLVCPDLQFDNGPNQHGAVWTSERPDGSRYVALGVMADRGRALSRAEQDAIKELVGESDDWPLGCGYDVEVLTGLGFLPVDPPLRDVPVTDADVYRALDVLLRFDEPTWWLKVRQLDEGGFVTVFDRLHPRVWDALERQCGYVRLPRKVA